MVITLPRLVAVHFDMINAMPLSLAVLPGASQESQNLHNYAPLDTVRLLQLARRSGSSALEGTLVSFPLNADYCPKFVALSYTWGQASYTKAIHLNERHFPVLDSLYPFLKLLPDLPEFPVETWWWIDSICINQNDEKEKTSQLEIMGKIYEKANETVVWLGDEVDESFGEDSRDCTNAIRNLLRLPDELDKANERNAPLDRAGELELKNPLRNIDWISVKRLLLRPWWRRVWTLQEFLISNKLTFYCGKNPISRGKLHKAIYAAWGCKGWDTALLGREAFFAGWNRRRMNQWYEDEAQRCDMGLVAMLAYVGDSWATDERDRIYSLLGVAKDSDMIRPLDPRSSVEDVYGELVMSFTSRYRSLDIICYSHLFNFHARRSGGDNLPSWIPDWRAHVESKVIPVMASQGSNVGTGNFRPTWAIGSKAAYRAAGDTLPSLEIFFDDKVLTCKGVVLDKIDGLGGSKFNDYGMIKLADDELPLEQPRRQYDSNPGHKNTPAIILLETISRCLVLDRKDRYLAKELPARHFRDVFQCSCMVCIEHITTEHIPLLFQDWFTVNRSLRIQGRTLEEICKERSGDFPVPFQKNFQKGPERKFFGRLEDTVGTMARRLTVTEKGHIGMAASRARRGDLICVLYGCSIPLLLRELGEEKFELIGECYLDGFMNGEALDIANRLPETQFHII